MLPTRHIRHALTTGLVVSLLVVLAPPATSPSQAASTYLCGGYQGCRSAGYSDGGYGAVNHKMYWRMYAGHNCTNYVAYRMIKDGMSAERPWSGSGMAYNWGHANRSITNKTPAVGAVAWWDRNTPGTSSSGHVAYVERVISNKVIVISEDQWGGNFYWRKITKERGWPTGFIHFQGAPDPQIQNVKRPYIEGTPRVGVALRSRVGEFKPVGKRHHRQWYADGVPIQGATGASYTPGVAQQGARISVNITATRSGYRPGNAVSAPGVPVALGEFTQLTAPTLTGDPVVGERLRAHPGSWSPQQERTNYRWLVDGERVRKRIAPTLELTPEMVGKQVTVVEVPLAEGYTKGEGPVARVLGPILRGRVTVVEPFRGAGESRLGESLSITPGVVQPTDAQVTYSWWRDGELVPGMTAPEYPLTPADIGATIKAQVTGAKDGFAGFRHNYLFDGPVRTSSDVTPKVVGKKAAAAVRVRVVGAGLREAGLPRPDGEVEVHIHTQVRTVTLRDGKAWVFVKGLKPGQRRYRITYRGTDVVEGSLATGTVRVKPPKKKRR